MVTIVAGRADDHSQHQQQYLRVERDGSVRLPPDVLDAQLPPGTDARVVRKPTGVELIREEPPS
jgi:hypothetical protein